MLLAAPTSRLVARTFARFLAAALALVAALAARDARAVTRPEAVARAQSWVDAGMPYCQCPNHQYDSHGLCSRPDNGDWDPYRSDCSGLVSYAWELPPPGRVTSTLWGVATVINAADLQPGDAIDSDEHVMLFAGWTVYPTVANLIDEHIWGTDARRGDFNVSINGSTITRSDWPSNPFTAIRYNGIQDSCAPSCNGSIIVGSDCGQGDCGAYGATCVDDSLGVRCVSVFCPAQGSSTLCIPNSQLIGTCDNGAISTGDCGAYGAICSEDGGAHCVAPWASALVAQGSDAPLDGDGSGAFRVCAGAEVDTWFDIRNIGYAAWTDVNDTEPTHIGKAIRLGTATADTHDFADPITGGGRISIAGDDNPDVHYDGGDCNDHAGCARTVFHARGKAPKTPGAVVTSWQLVDETRTWFGPVMAATYHVVACENGGTGGSSASTGSGHGSGSGSGGHASGAGGGGGDGDAGGPNGDQGGCAFAPGPSSSSSSFGIAFALVAAAAIVRARRRRLAAAGAAALALAATACAAPDGAAEHVGEAAEADQVCAGGATTPGIDVSIYQGGIDWGAVANGGYKFAIARINDGHSMDSQFGANWAGIQSVGMIRGAYQFYEPTMDPTEQANIVIAAVGMLGQGDLPVTLDVEWTSGTPNANDIGTWVDLVTQGTGKRPMIYTALGYWNQYFHGEFGNIDLWVANWSVSCPNLPDSWSNWIFWQTGGGGVPGIAGNVDQDVFNGSLEDLIILANANTSMNCAASGAGACAHFGCACVDDGCNGGFCPGTGCTAQHTADCGNFGCNCVDGACSGGYCPGTGCTAKETLDCQNFGCGCVDHQCAGGACAGTGCTAKQTLDCQAFGQDCSMGNCVPPGTGASSSSSSGAGGGTGGGAEGGHANEGGGGNGDGAHHGHGAGGPGHGATGGTGGSGGSADGDPGDGSGCAFATSAPATGGVWLALLGLAAFVRRRR